MASEHVSVRMKRELIEHLDAASRRARVSRSEMLKTLVEEGLRMREHPGIVFRDGPMGRRAGLARGADIWQVVESFRGAEQPESDSIPVVAGNIGIDESQVRAALRYYAEFPEEIDAMIERNDRELEPAFAALPRAKLASAGA